MIDKTVKVACMGATTLNLSQLNILQKDLKSLSHDDYEKYKKEIIDTGYAFPIKVWRDEDKKFWIVGGTQSFRVLTEMQKEGWSIPLIPVTLVEAKDKKQAMRRVLQDASSYGKMESDGLYEFLQLAEMNIEDFNKSFRTPEIDHEEFKDEFFEQINDDGLTDEDEVPEVKESFVKLGDLWRLGDHRLLCGDSTDPLLVSNLVGQETMDMVFTDPPYGMNLDTDYSKLPSTKAEGNKKYKSVLGDDKEFDPTMILSIFEYCEEIFLWGFDYYAHKLPQGTPIVWDKRVEEKFDEMFGSAFELCWSKNKHKRVIARFNNTLFGGDIEARNKVHPTQKPTKLIEWFFDKWGKDKINIIDLYGGSGSTLIACEKTKRKCFMMELDEHYCGVIIERWQKYTGLKAEKIN